MRRSAVVLGTSLLLAILAACGDDATTADADAIAADPLSGGATTVFDTTKYAFSNQAANLTNATASTFTFGHSIFKRNWVTAPATTEGMDGLGPRFNQRSCSACHSDDGRSAPFDNAGNQLGFLFRLSVPGTDAHGGPLGDAVYGTQLRTNAIQGVPDDGVPHTTYAERAGTYGDGTSYSLRVPTQTIDGWAFGPPAAGFMISARVAPYTIGLGLLQAVPEASLLANVRANDRDGVKGHANHVWDATTGTMQIGRFGWKANVPNVLAQTEGALAGDIGITSKYSPAQSCSDAMAACKAAPTDPTEPYEISDDKLTALDVYMRTLAVPARRSVDDPTAKRGAALFASFRCTTCHVSELVTGDSVDIPELAHQKIHPYSDLLLHDMGPELADGRPDYEAGPQDWRTPPLWGIGLLQTVNGHEYLLHDGRARGVEEAILWHGGEATASRERFRTASAEDRKALVFFVHSL